MKKNVGIGLIVMVMVLLNVFILPTKVSALEQGDMAIATIGENKYNSLQEAFNAVASDQKETTVNILRDFMMSTQDIATLSVNKNVVLNMNGKTINVDNLFVGRPIVNNGTLRVIGNGVIDSSMANNGYGAINNNGKLIIDNGTFSGYIFASGACIKNAGTLIINDGIFNKATSAIYNSEDGTATINNGVFDTHSCSKCHVSSWAYTVRSFGNLTFNGGTVYGVQGALAIAGGKAKVNGGYFETVGCSTHGTGPAFYALYVAGERGQTEAEINGGKYISVSKQAVLVGNDNDGGEKLPAKCTINDGEFITKGDAAIPVIVSAAKTGDPLIFGGTFCKTIDTAFLGVNHKLFDNKNGTYTVVPNVASVALNKKEELVEVGKTITLVAKILPEKVKDEITWISSNPLVATVDESGRVIAKSIGKTEITVSVDGMSSSCIISVFKVEKPSIPTIDTSKPTEGVQVGIGDTQSQQTITNSVNNIIDKIAKGETIPTTIISSDTFNNVQEALKKGEVIETVVDVKSVQDSLVDKDDVHKITNWFETSKDLNGKATVAQYLDLSILLVSNGKTLGKVNQIDDMIEFTMSIPANLLKENREFYVLRIHNDLVEKLIATLNDDGTLSFMTDRFSTYALVYEDKVFTPTIPENPSIDTKNPVQTNDNLDINIYVVGSLVNMLVGFCIVIMKRKDITD